MPHALPLRPMLVTLVGSSLLGFSLFLLLQSEASETSSDLEYFGGSVANAEGAPLTYNDPVRARGYVDIVLGQSPFVKDRSAYRRNLVQAPEPTLPELTPEFVGVMSNEGETEALVVWRTEEGAKSHSIGDETPWGVLISISPTRLVFESVEGQKELDLF